MSKEKPVLSIIMPIYNCVNYIERSITSIINQTYIKWELILVDDGSTDGSEERCDDYARKDGRITVIHQVNAGVSAARNSGLNKANGLYVMFVDADDFLSENYCEQLMQYATNVDLVIGGYTQVAKQAQCCFSVATEYVSLDNIGTVFDELYAKHLSNAPWAKIYRHFVIGTQRFDESVQLGEDLLFNLEYFSKCDKIQLVNQCGYFYNCVNDGAATKKYRDSDCRQIVELYKATKLFVKQYCGKIKSDIVEKTLCLTGLYLIQSIYYSEKAFSKKNESVNELLESLEFQFSCSLQYGFPIQQRIPQQLVKYKSACLLGLFFCAKKFVYAFMRKWSD